MVTFGGVKLIHTHGLGLQLTFQFESILWLHTATWVYGQSVLGSIGRCVAATSDDVPVEVQENRMNENILPFHPKYLR